MKSTYIGREENTVTFKMDFTAEDFDQALNQAYQANRGRFSLNGFRKGKAPRKLIETHYGQDVFFEDAINHLFADAYPAALDEWSVEPVDQPDVEFGQIEAGQGFSVTVKVAVPPEVEVDHYKGLKRPKFDATVSDEDVQKDIDVMRQRNGRLVSVDRPAQNGDNLIIDYTGVIDGIPFEGGTAERQPLRLGGQTFIPGFEDQLIGVKPGEERDVRVTFPEDYPAPEMAGQEAVFYCKVHEIKENELPELNDEFAKDVSVFDTLEELRQDVRAKLEKAAADKAVYEGKNAVLEQLYDAHNFDVPNAMIETQIDEMLKELEQQLKYQGLTMEQYLGFMDKDAASLRADTQPDAVRRVKTRLLVDAVAKKEQMEASEADMEAELKGMAEIYKLEPERMKELLQADGLKLMANDIRYRKAVDFLFESAVVAE